MAATNWANRAFPAGGGPGGPGGPSGPGGPGTGGGGGAGGGPPPPLAPPAPLPGGGTGAAIAKTQCNKESSSTLWVNSWRTGG